MKKIIYIYLTCFLLVACKVQNVNKDIENIEQNNKILPTLDISSVDKLFDKWDKAWSEGQYELIPSCVTNNYIRHDIEGDRIISRDDYSKEIMQIRNALPDIQFLIHDRSIEADRVWIRYTLKYSDPKTGKMINQKGMQVYRIEQNKLAETWLVLQEAGTEWPEVTK
ncbi:SnoaL-like polyketide cyclase [Algoriphagus faecimaris]|uniref:SnoaL-like polyketide cyclase n=1 Tax=Algoriphagus faecimaris TaxID=686796 RepID=A0A1G6Q979_9BACT|nr:ester cyclase [Algoriphagus faecimaris]SDC88246.1 SnoaL-like polyketide cyclase [Algoriphagus faecimaris]